MYILFPIASIDFVRSASNTLCKNVTPNVRAAEGTSSQQGT
jgi:hypothetical protein